MKAECQTKHKLLETAMQLLWENSYGSVSVEDICQRAGVNKGSFYYFFPSKSDLTVAAMEEHWQEKKVNWDRIFSAQSPVLKRLDDISTHILKTQEEKKEQFGKVCGCPYVSIGTELGTQDEKIRLKIEELIERSCLYWRTFIRDAQAEGLVNSEEDPKQMAREIYSYVLGLVIQARLINDLKPLKSIKSGVERLLSLKTALAV